jgi:hypothetical protein
MGRGIETLQPLHTGGISSPHRVRLLEGLPSQENVRAGSLFAESQTGSDKPLDLAGTLVCSGCRQCRLQDSVAMKTIALALSLTATLMLGGCRGAGTSSTKAPTHVSLNGDVGILRDAFNSDLGKVRAIFIASPT